MTPLDPPVLKSRALIAGDEIVLIAPAGPFDRDRFSAGVNRLREWGFRPTWREDIFNQEGYLAGNDHRRMEELQQAMDGDAPCVWCVRGGYGTLRLIDSLDLGRFHHQPKLIIGFSDITILGWDLWRRAHVAGIHGPMIAGEQFQADDSTLADWYRRLIQDVSPPGMAPLGDCETVVGGCASGHVMPGNLTLIVHLLAAGRCPDLAGTILVIEDTGEAAYRIDRMLVTLRLSGALDHIAGLVFGEFSGVESEQIRRLAEETARALGNVPCVTGAGFGHGAINVALPIGTLAKLDADRGIIELLESPVC